MDGAEMTPAAINAVAMMFKTFISVLSDSWCSSLARKTSLNGQIWFSLATDSMM
jgi:hypothetical protein